MDQALIVLFVGIFIVVAFCLNRLPIGIVSMIVAVLLRVTGVLTDAQAFGGLSSNTAVQYAALFVLGEGLNRTSIVGRLKSMLKGLYGKERKVIIMVSLVSMVIAILTTSNTSAAVILPIALIIARETGVSKKRVLKPANDLANMWIGILPIGLGLMGLTLVNGTLAAVGVSERFGNFTTSMAVVPILTIITVFVFAVGYKLYPDRTKEEIEEGAKRESSAKQDGSTEEKLTDLSPVADKIGIALFFVTILITILASYIDLPFMEAHIISVIGALLMTVLGVVPGKEAYKAIHLDIIFLFGGMSAFATAMLTSGAANHIGNFMSNIINESTPTWIVIGLFWMVPFLMTQFMNNIPCLQLMLVIEISTAVAIGMNPITAALCTISGSLCSIMLPSAAGAQALIFAPGGFTMKDYLKGGLPIAALYLVLVIIWFPIVAPPF